MEMLLNHYLFDSRSALVLHGNKSLTDADLDQLLDFDNEQRRKIRVVVLSHTNITGGCIQRLAILTNLKRLYLQSTCITDDAPFEILPMTVELVNLDDTCATDLSVSKLSRLPQLKFLSLRHTHVTDRAAHQLETVNTLREVCLAETLVSDHAKRRLDNKLVLDTIRFPMVMRIVQLHLSMALRTVVRWMRPDPRRYL